MSILRAIVRGFGYVLAGIVAVVVWLLAALVSIVLTVLPWALGIFAALWLAHHFGLI